MKRYFILFLSLLICGEMKSQSASVPDTAGLAGNILRIQNSWNWTDSLTKADYTRVDTVVLKLKKKFKSTAALAEYMNASFPDQDDRVRAIFRWMTNSIAYDCALYHSKNRSIKGIHYEKGMSKESKAALWEEVYSDYANKVLRKRKAVCEGYATLFYELCVQCNIPCEVVVGYADKPSAIARKKGRAVFFRKQDNFACNHAWNRVYLHQTWLYLDPTWASGYTDPKVQHFTRSFSPDYYLVSKDALYPSHAVNVKRTKKRNDLVGNTDSTVGKIVNN